MPSLGTTNGLPFPPRCPDCPKKTFLAHPRGYFSGEGQWLGHGPEICGIGVVALPGPSRSGWPFFGREKNTSFRKVSILRPEGYEPPTLPLRHETGYLWDYCCGRTLYEGRNLCTAAATQTTVADTARLPRQGTTICAGQGRVGFRRHVTTSSDTAYAVTTGCPVVGSGPMVIVTTDTKVSHRSCSAGGRT